MCKKGRLSAYRKNEFRKHRAASSGLHVGIPRKTVSVLSVSVSRSIYLEAPVSSPEQLKNRLKVVPVTPDGKWIHRWCTLATNTFVLHMYSCRLA